MRATNAHVRKISQFCLTLKFRGRPFLFFGHDRHELGHVSSLVNMDPGVIVFVNKVIWSELLHQTDYSFCFGVHILGWFVRPNYISRKRVQESSNDIMAGSFAVRQSKTI